MDRESAGLRCIVCGGDHEPSSRSCDSSGMDREIARMGARKWNEITAAVSRRINQEAAKARRNGYTQPVDITFSIPELRALAAALSATLAAQSWEAERKDHEATLKAWDADEERRQF